MILLYALLAALTVIMITGSVAVTCLMTMFIKDIFEDKE